MDIIAVADQMFPALHSDAFNAVVGREPRREPSGTIVMTVHVHVCVQCDNHSSLECTGLLT